MRSILPHHPAPFSIYTTKDLWTDPHIAQQMLKYHLDSSSDLASRSKEKIVKSINFFESFFKTNKLNKILDLGCGPGLYSHQLAQRGFHLTGLDFSHSSIQYAREQAKLDSLPINYLEADYLLQFPSEKFDAVLLIYCDFCALSPSNRGHLIHSVSQVLTQNGYFIFDIHTQKYFQNKIETTKFTDFPTGGFWSPRPYYELHETLLYPDEFISLDKFSIIESSSVKTVFNWLEHFDANKIQQELYQNNFTIKYTYANFQGSSLSGDSSEMAIFAQPF